MCYASVLMAVELVRQLVPGTLLAKVDLHQASRLLSVHADNLYLLGIECGSGTYIDTLRLMVSPQNIFSRSGMDPG